MFLPESLNFCERKTDNGVWAIANSVRKGGEVMKPLPLSLWRNLKPYWPLLVRLILWLLFEILGVPTWFE
jgi:hypothetical protein